MKKFIQLLILSAFLNSCTSTKNYSNRKDADNALQNAVQNLDKNSNNESAGKILPALYADVQHLHLSNIKNFKAENNDASPRWNDIILEYQALQNAYNLITNSVVANTLVKAANYESNILETKEAAGKHFYQLAESLLGKDGRKNAQQALAYFKVCNYYVPGYQKVKSMISTAYERAVINVVIDSLEDHSYFIKVGQDQKGFVSFNDLFQQNLKTALQDDFLNSENPVSFYTNKEAAAKNVRVDWTINLDLTKMSISASTVLLDNAPPAPGGYVPENVVTYIIPNYSAQNGSEPSRPQYFGNSDVFTYPPPPGSLVYNSNNHDVFINGILYAKIKDEKKKLNISSGTLYARYQLPKVPTFSAGQVANHNAGLQKLFIEFYPQIEEAVNRALN